MIRFICDICQKPMQSEQDWHRCNVLIERVKQTHVIPDSPFWSNAAFVPSDTYIEEGNLVSDIVTLFHTR